MQPEGGDRLIAISALRRPNPKPAMIDATLLLPPGFGPMANPVLFGVSDGLMRLLPLQDAADHDIVWPDAPNRQGEGSGSALANGQTWSQADRAG